MLCAALAAYPATAADRVPELPASLGVGALALLVVALAARWPSVIPWSIVALGASYGLELALRRDTVTIDAAAPVYGGGLLLLGELTYWSVELRGRQRAERPLLLRRTGALLLLAGGSTVVAALVLAVTSLSPAGGVVWHALGVAAAVAALALIARLVPGNASRH